MNTHLDKHATKPERARVPVCFKPARTLAEHVARQQEIASLALFLLLVRQAQVRAS